YRIFMIYAIILSNWKCMAERPKLFKIDDEMKRWCVAIGDELLAWPDVTAKPMFGMTGFYRGQNIFAAIPRTKAPVTARSLLIKLPSVRHKRLKDATGPGSGWVAFELESANDINEALLWLGRAYEENS
ncbi:MAG TPA: hypothetical protein VLB68_05655, partial [Pyrinomonadaceae bacterium]|nr:hypothetical protein [Pyrinomonadaceae bacterium]